MLLLLFADQSVGTLNVLARDESARKKSSPVTDVNNTSNTDLIHDEATFISPHDPNKKIDDAEINIVNDIASTESHHVTNEHQNLNGHLSEPLIESEPAECTSQGIF